MTDAMNRFALENVKYEHSQKHMLRVQTLKKPNKQPGNVCIKYLSDYV